MKPAPAAIAGLLLYLALNLAACGRFSVDRQKAEFGALQRPASLPGFVKIYPGGHVNVVQEAFGTVCVSYVSEADVKTLQAFYRDEAIKNGLETETVEPRSARVPDVFVKYSHLGAPRPQLHMLIIQRGSGPVAVRLIFIKR